MKTQINAALFHLATGKFSILLPCLLAGYVCPAQRTPTPLSVFYINVPEDYDQCNAANAQLLVEGIETNNSSYQRLHEYVPGRAVLVMQSIGDFRVTLIGLGCPMLDIYEPNGDGTTTKRQDVNPAPSARLRCYGGRFNVTLH